MALQSTVATLGVFRDPSSVAVVGASGDPAKWGHWLARGALSGTERREVYLVNQHRTPTLGTASYGSLRELPATPELVAVCVPPRFVGPVVDEALDLGVRGFLGITSSVPNEADLAARIRTAGARMIGMNSLGLYDASTRLHLAWGSFTPGSIAVISQSGQLGSEISNLAARAGLGISRFVSIGNQSDVVAAELLRDLLTDDATSVVALYLESFSAGREIVSAVADLRAAGKQTLLLTIGASAAGSRLARSHTGSLTSGTDVVDAAARAAGAVRVTTPSELVDVARMLLRAGPPAGNRVAIVGDSGGQTGIAADVASTLGLDVPEFSAPLQTAISERLPAGAACANPVDLAGAGEQDLHSYATLTSLLLDSAEVDAVVLTGYFGTYGDDIPALARDELDVAAALGEAVRRSGKPLLVHTMSVANAVTAGLGELKIPAYPSIETALRALKYASGFRGGPRALNCPPAQRASVSAGYPAARQLLIDAGVAFPGSVVVRDLSDIPQAANRLSAPYVLKAGWLEHKSEMGGVRMGLADTTELAAAFAEMSGRLGDGEYVIEELDTRPDTVEMLVGVRRDPDLGPVIVVGAGGTEAEVYRDVAVELAPVDATTATQMLNRLACSALLHGWRGRPPVDVDALVRTIVAVSELGSSLTQVAEIEINPVRVAPQGALAVDALVVSAEPEGQL